MPNPLIFTAFVAAVAFVAWRLVQPTTGGDDDWGIW